MLLFCGWNLKNSHWKCILMYVTVVALLINHAHQDSTVLDINTVRGFNTWTALEFKKSDLNNYFLPNIKWNLELNWSESKMRRELKIMFLYKEQATYNKPLLIQSQLIWVLDNPDWQIWKIPLTSAYVLWKTQWI
jgi:hypothetical protein